MKTVNIKGKNYVMVNERIKHFRTSEEYKGWSLSTEIISLTEDSCVLKAIICDENGVIKATGIAQEDRTSSMINKTSFVENCETSAWGRALGCLGIGIDDSIATAEEVNMAVKKQEQFQQLKCRCADCDEIISEKVALYSLKNYGKELCYNCQKNQIKEVDV